MRYAYQAYNVCCNLLISLDLVGRIRRLRRIRHEATYSILAIWRQPKLPINNYFASVAVPLACQSNTPNSKPFRSPLHPTSADPSRYQPSSLSGIWRSQPDRQTDPGPPAKIAARRRWSRIRTRHWVLFFRFDGVNNGFVRRNLIVVLRLGHQQPFR